MKNDKSSYLKIIASLIGIILLLFIYMSIKPPKIQEVEVIKEIEIEVIKEKEVEVEKIVEVEVEVEPAYKYHISSVEREMLARLVYLEANTESLECQAAIVSVIINRWQNGAWGDTITSVIYSPYQFSPAGLIYKTTPTETNYTAVDQVIKNGSIFPQWVLYFRADYHFNWEGYAPYAKIDNTCFGYFVADK